MRIGVIVERFPSISETFILSQITGMIDLGHQVDILSFQKPDESILIHQSITDYNLLERTTYFEFPQDRIQRLLLAIRLFIKFIVKNPVRTIKFLNVKGHGIFGAFNRLFLADPFFGNRYDIVHCHFGSTAIKCLFLKDVMNIKLITSFHGHDISRYPRRMGQNVYVRLFEKGDYFTANSNFTRDALIKLGCNPQKIRKLPMGVSLDEFQNNKRDLEKHGTIKIVTVARLVEKKGLQYAIRAISKLITKNIHVEYRIAGDGPLREMLQKLIHDLALEKHVKLLGWKTAHEVKNLLNESHIFVLPSVTAVDGDQEGQGVVLLEAQASGLPVIATIHNGFPESLIDGNTGYLVPERDADSISSKLENLINDPIKILEMGWRGRRFVKERFDIKELNKELESLYKELLAVK